MRVSESLLNDLSGIPGEPKGLHYIHQRYGKLAWSEIFQPAIKLARHGFRITADFSKAMDSTVHLYGYDFLAKDPAWAEDFAPNGTRSTLR